MPFPNEWRSLHGNADATPRPGCGRCGRVGRNGLAGGLRSAADVSGRPEPVVGALGGAYAGNRLEKSQAQVAYQIGVKYDDGSWATIRQAAPTGLSIGDRVRITDSGVELLR